MPKRTISILRKIGAILIGVPVLILGVILIPLPGPGLLVCLLGLVILSTEFEWAEKYRDKALKSLKDIFTNAQKRAETMAAKADKSKDARQSEAKNESKKDA